MLRPLRVVNLRKDGSKLTFGDRPDSLEANIRGIVINLLVPPQLTLVRI